MPLSAAQMQAKVDKTSTNMDRLDGIINGGDTTDVSTDNGLVPSFAKVLKGFRDQADDVLAEYGDLTTLAGQVRNDAEQVSDDATQTAADRVQTGQDRAVSVSAAESASVARDAVLDALPANVFGTYAAASAALGSVADGDYIQVLVDETKASFRSLYRKVSGTLVFQNYQGNAPALGVAATASNMGAFAEDIIPDGVTTKEALQSLETAQRHFIDDLNSGANGKGAALVRFGILNGSAVTRTVSDKLRDIYHIKDFGAACDGSIDDYAAFMEAVSAVQSKGGGCLHLSGRILVNDTVVIEGGGITLIGENHQSTWIINGQTDAPAVQFGNGTDNGNRNSIFDVIFGQKSGVTSVSGNCGLKLMKQSNFIISNVHMFEYPGQLYDGFVADDSTGTHITNLSVQATKNDGWRLTKCLDTYANNSRSDTSVRGIKFVDCPGVYFNNIACFGNTTHGWDIGSAGVIDDSVYHFYTNCIGDTSGSHNWNITQLSIGVFTACWGSTQISQSVNVEAAGFYFSGGKVSDISMLAPVAITNNGAGIHIDYAARVSVAGAIAGCTYKDGAQNGRGGSGSGIRIGEFANRVGVTGGVCENNTSYGIDIDLGADRVNIAGVELRDNVIGSIRNNANASVHKVKISNCGGYNPLGAFTPTPAFPASGAAVTNLTGVDCMVYITGGTLTNLTVNGAYLFSDGPCSVMVPAGSTITPTYSSLPTWKWMGL